MKFESYERFWIALANRSLWLFVVVGITLKAWNLFALKFIIPPLVLILTPIVVIWRILFSNEED